MMKSNLLIFFFFLGYCHLCPKKFANFQVTKISFYFFLLRAFWFSLLSSGFAHDLSQIHFLLMIWGGFIFFHMNIQLFQHHWLRWLPCPPWNSFGVFVKSSCLQLLLGLWGWLLGIVVWLPESLTSRERVGFPSWWFLRAGFSGWLLQVVGQSPALIHVWLLSVCIFSVSSITDICKHVSSRINNLGKIVR